ncbi:MAG: purine-binding chemotaxis protein [Methanocella sp. PtaU1.Bin125]|nr:MAG: purine-binding chemotaxis protein [Methanocella sp. PtaU1.Bin125]
MAGNVKEGLQVVAYRAGETEFGADIRDVREIIKLDSLTAIPGAAAHVEGVINVRGEVVPLMSLRNLTGVPIVPHDMETRVLILDRKPPLGLIVDTVGEVKTIPPGSVEPMPSITGIAGNGSLYKGIAKLPDRMIILMDLKKISASADEDSADVVSAEPMPADVAPALDDGGYVKLTEFQLDALRELGNIGTSHAATSLSQLVGSTINITVPAIALEKIEHISSIISEEKVVGILLDIRDGDNTVGYLYTMFPERSAFRIVDTLMGQPLGTTGGITEVEQSAIMEVGNILASSFCDALAEFLGMVLLPSPPCFVCDMADAIVENSLIAIGQVADDAIIFRTDLMDDQRIYDGYVIMLPNPEMLGRMLSILEAKANP